MSANHHLPPSEHRAGTSSETPASILRVAVPCPLPRCFDYLPPAALQAADIPAGTRLRVPFGRRKVVGIVLGHGAQADIAADRLKRALTVLDDEPLLPPSLLTLTQWAAHYYHHPIGEVMGSVLPPHLRHGRSLRTMAPASAAAPEEHPQAPGAPLALNTPQQTAVDAIAAAHGSFTVLLLEGVTGSGKTEVYLRAIAAVLAEGQQALVLVPEIGLTPQLVARFRERFAVPLAVMHSGLTDRERTLAWLAARDGDAPIVIGTRSAVFTPMARPGLIIVDEEHDLSLKQQEGFRYSARDIAVMRGKLETIPVVLGSATPSLESYANALQGRYQHLTLPHRAGAALPPAIRLVDVRGQRLRQSLSPRLLSEIAAHLQQDGQVLLFLNRRGFAPVLMCHDCGWVAACRRCDARLTLHLADNRLRCHHCGAEQPVTQQCPQCGGDEVIAIGKGTERVDQVLREQFPDVAIARIDRDTTRRKGALQDLLDSAQSGAARILVGTQMLAKGHHFPNVTLVGILDADHGLFSVDFRAAERMAQLLVQVAGRAGRAERPGTVLIQTHHPDHPLLRLLVDAGYPAFCRAALEERRAAQLPPFSSLALLRAEAVAADTPLQFLAQAAEQAQQLEPPGVEILGPVPAPMGKRAGRYRAHLLLQAARRSDLQRLLDKLTPRLGDLPLARKVRWSLDVDALDLY